MTVDDIKKFYGVKTNVEVGKIFNVSKVAVGEWEENGIPVLRQTAIQVLSGNQLKADISTLKQLEPA